ncbi:PREDICTED: paramyosin [Vollenhovia emeryi]|uniref:paramyosin n=1 Tax=Vollenhovia emeryi TaxID=411798 RepID=UPI0005F39A1D|nr:PREDICTED: paramyosin [Vollenhovia emeryi]
MRIESPGGMEQRLSNPSRPPRQTPPSHSRKSKRRSGRRSNPADAWPSAPRSEDGGLVAGVEYPPQQMLWQSAGVPQSVPGNGQRLFTAMSDPSVCGYSPMPMTYAMQPVSLPAMYRMYQPMPVPNVTAVHGRQRHRCNRHSANVRPGANNNVVNGYESLRENGVLEPAVHIALQNGDYTSLPPTANKDSGVNGDELSSEHRRYSDPGLGPAGNSACSDIDDSDSVESGSSVTTISRSNKLVLSLIEQMTELKKCNSQLFKELSETKSSLESVKAKLAQCKHSTPADYQPGMLSEFIREIRDANRSCEEGLITKVKSMLEERCNQQARETDELKNQLAKLMREKEESDQRVAKLEEEMTALKLSATNEGREIAVFEEENLALRRELQEARASRTLAENHAAKCVNFAVSRSVTPVTFDTPCITSTPVRTALTDTRFLSLSVPPASQTSSASAVLRCRSVAEVAAPQPTSEADQCRNFATGSEAASRENSPTKEDAWQTVSTTYNTAITWVEEASQNSKCQITNAEAIYQLLSEIELKDCLGFREEKACDATRNNRVKSTMTEKEREKKDSLTSIPEELSTDDQLLEISEATIQKAMEMLSVMRQDGAENRGSPEVLEEQKDPLAKLSDVPSKADKLMYLSDSQSDSFQQKLCKFNNQRGSFKKPRRKKGHLRKLFIKADEPDEDPRQDIRILADAVPPCTSGSNRDTANGDGDRFPGDDRTSRAITDVPDVVVIGGGPIVPKDLCSMRTLTSRTQTAPSRATYTTAYI